MKETYTAAEFKALQKAGASATVKVRRKKTEAQKQLEEALQRHRIKELSKATGQEVTAEFQFHPDRQWKFDFYIPAAKCGIEVEGGVWLDGGGRHNRGEGYMKDLTKYNSATAMGYKVLRFTPDQLLHPNAYRLIRQAIELSETDTKKQ